MKLSELVELLQGELAKGDCPVVLIIDTKRDVKVSRRTSENGSIIVWRDVDDVLTLGGEEE